jgi:hypothetical protein
MRRFLNNLFRDFRTTKTARPARRAPRRANLQLEGLEDRMALSTVSQVGSTLLVADPGLNSVIHGNGSSGIVQNNQQIAFQADPAQPSKVQGLDQGIKVNEYSIKKSTDSWSPAFFQNYCQGAHYRTVSL